MANGTLPDDFTGEHYKRLWMLIMYLRRDKGVVRCLLRRALDRVPNGMQAFDSWIDEGYFDPNECELPVDTRVLSGWKKFGLFDPPAQKVKEVAEQARKLAREKGVAPASFDAILFFR